MMYLTTLALVALSCLGSSRGQSSVAPQDPTCALISRSISSSSAVFYPTDSSGQPSASYEQGISHWAITSTQRSKCVVEPGTAADVSKILRILGKARTPFAVKGGGHTVNPGFSSTTGVHIAMTRFSEVTYDKGHQTATVGAGLIWDDVYAALAPHKVNVLGGRATGIGVAGFILGGGYSWKVNQHGLTIDTVVAFELVKPDGTILQVTKTAHPDLFFGLKGGLNNFGIVTRFTLKAFPQTDVWGGITVITQPNLDQVSAATVDFATNVKDPKASVITTYNFIFGQPTASLFLFYDGPNPPRGIFEKFLDIPSAMKDIETRDFLSLVQASPANQSFGRRGTFNAASLTAFTPNMLQVILKECTDLGTQLSGPNSTDLISYDVDPFLPTLFSHNDSPSAYPPNRNVVFFPVSLYYAWSDPARDEVFRSAIHESAARIQAAAVAEGQRINATSLYPNYAIFDTPLQRMYGNNVPKLVALKKLHDPSNVMGLAGGFKF